MKKTIFLSRRAIIIISLFVFLLLYYFLVPPFPMPEIPITSDTETAGKLYDDLCKITENIGIEDIEMPTGLSVERLEKLHKELARILEKTELSRPCVQYALVAIESGNFPSYNSGGVIFLKEGEVWKYGKTIHGESGRYSSGLPYPNLEFRVELLGTEMQCLVMEKIKIYSYLTLPENIKRAKITKTPPLLRPPGNRIDR